MNTNQQIEIQEMDKRLREVEAFMNSFKKGNSISRDVETSLRDRLKGLALSSLIYGQATMSGGKVDITDPRITSQSVGVATRLNSSSNYALANAELASGYLSGHTWRFFEGTFSASYEIAYIIIP